MPNSGGSSTGTDSLKRSNKCSFDEVFSGRLNEILQSIPDASRRSTGGLYLLKWSLLLVYSFVWLACGTGELAAEGPAKHVVMISVDGLPAYLLDDPNLPLTTIRGLAAEGAMAAGMRPSNPSVTWPNHTTLVTGAHPVDHGVLFNGVLVRGGLGLPIRVDPRKDKSELVLIPTLFDVLHEQGRHSVGINWPCTRNSGTLLVDFPDSPESLDHSTPEFLESMQAAGVVTQEDLERFPRLSPISRDRIWTQAACHAIRTHQPSFLMFHLLNVDAVHHRYGPRTWAGYSAVAYADRCVQDVLDALDAAGIRDQTTVLIVSDHGFITIPKTLQPNVVLRQAGLLTVEGTQVVTADAMIFPEGGIAMLYLTRPDRLQELQAEVIKLFEGQEGIAEILTPDRYEQFGLPQPDEYEQMANLVLVAKSGYGFSAGATGDNFVVESTTTLGTHGFLHTYEEMQATFIAAGAGIRKGARLGVISNTSVAPTAAHLLGVKLPAATGSVLTEILLENK